MAKTTAKHIAAEQTKADQYYQNAMAQYAWRIVQQRKQAEKAVGS